MTRPDSGSPDQSANQDDAVWLDLVARLEGTSFAEGSTADGSTAKDGPAPNAPDNPNDPDIPDAEGPDAPGPTPSLAPGTTPGRPATFRDFDPLGLAGRAPTELSAAERSAAARSGSAGQPRSGGATGTGQDGHDIQGSPRDYAVEDDGGDFVPEEPPSLSGTDPLTMLAWLGAVGGPIALLLSAMFWRSAPLLAIVGMVSAFILAVVYLIMKLPQEKDDNDDGARV